ncbi:histidine kinase [Pseudoflavitalea sp. X16]|uniref:tetratricopeptide repeat-containing sensor histidine kinase n=1 Tax=Paraflavitalea devenefica TaxID=2716334 RepID=UPI0014228E1C|nr:histidine kinase dimerization/phosphoacceptor domain -containing protein [Paraflavitalea devenefica]NII23813.1 histidine kinase [Paraflavitalea devenefica]
MLRVWLIASVLVIVARAAKGQEASGNSYATLMNRLQRSLPDTNRIKILLEIAWYYDVKPGVHTNVSDSGIAYATKAKQLSDQLRAVAWQHKSLFMLGEMYFEQRDYDQGRSCFLQVIDHFQKTGDKEQEAAVWTRLANTIPDQKLASNMDSAFAEHLRYFKLARELYRQTGNREKEIAALKDVADVYMHQGKLDSAEQGFLRVLKMYQDIGYANLHYTYDLLSAVATAKGNYEKALFYALETVRSMQATADSVSGGYFYGRLGSVYRELGHFDKCAEWYGRAVIFFQQNLELALHGPMHRFNGHQVRALIRQKKEKEALKLVLSTRDKFPPVRLADKQAVATSLGDCYTALKQYALAEQHYLEMIAWEEKMDQGNVFTFEVYFTMGEFYLNRHRYDHARRYLEKAMAMPPGIALTSRIRDLHFFLFKVDSATGSYLAAIDHFNSYKTLNDSLFNESKSRQIEELQVAYETGKKEQNISALERENQLQQSRLKQAKLTGNLTIGAVVLLLIIVGLLYNRYLIRQRSNRRLEAKQEEINRQNQSLQQLVTEKDRLLEEKEWLLKEIHHRVKNNLQIVISLLNTQSAYLDNDAALMAIRDSQHRMRAMSLIHQRLYQSETESAIDMQAYIRELVEYLSDNFNLSHKIGFSLQVEKIAMDVAQAVPVGLILNESITNAFKYAFPDNSEGTINILMKQDQDSHVLLVIADNGRGLPAGFDTAAVRSLGMNLMQGLTKQLNGVFIIQSDKGVSIMIRFPHGRMAVYEN